MHGPASGNWSLWAASVLIDAKDLQGYEAPPPPHDPLPQIHIATAMTAGTMSPEEALLSCD